MDSFNAESLVSQARRVVVSPVTLAPGRARLVTSLLRTGSPPVRMTIGIVGVDPLAALAALESMANIISLLSRTSSSASCGSCSKLRSAKRCSKLIVFPSV